MPDPAIARRLIACLDLTDLADDATEAGTDALCARALGVPVDRAAADGVREDALRARALGGPGPVAAVCVWPRFVARARAALGGSAVRVATVANFPHGRDPVEGVLAEVEAALADGADEIDLVLPHERFLRRGAGAAEALVRAVRGRVDGGRLLKLILETGALLDPGAIREAGALGLAAGADFLKTSTGKSAVSATPEAARVMLETIRASGRPAGLKVSGGIRTYADAAAYLALAEEVMGRAWANPTTFRVGASALHGALLGAIEGAP